MTCALETSVQLMRWKPFVSYKVAKHTKYSHAVMFDHEGVDN